MSSAAAAVQRIITHRSKESLRAMRYSLDRSIQVGFVPTMGALHEGHLSLVRRARAENDIVIASIFVNPTQFGPNEDLDKYPRQLQRDTELLEEMGVDHLFAPDTMYGTHHVTYVEPQGFDDLPEGKVRPGHFRGVATIVTKLFNLVQPNKAYFGQKDAAQCVLIRRIVQDLDLDVNVIISETVREPDGLAMSSRNAYLTDQERRAAPIVFQSLCAARKLVQQLDDECISRETLCEAVQNVLRTEPMVAEIQYISVDSKDTMQRCEHVSKKEGAIMSIACKVGSVRLIDNIVL